MRNICHVALLLDVVFTDWVLGVVGIMLGVAPPVNVLALGLALGLHLLNNLLYHLSLLLGLDFLQHLQRNRSLINSSDS